MTKMSNRAKEALCGSIEKWIGVVEGYIKERGVNNCPLCVLYHDIIIGCSINCPVKRKTKINFCNRTPYPIYHQKSRIGDKNQIKSAAIEELEFLISLWPKDEDEKEIE